MTIEAARRLAPPDLNWELIHHSQSGDTHSWGYDDEDRKVYVIFGKPSDPKKKIMMYAYLDIALDVVTRIRESDRPSLVIRHELAGGDGVEGVRLYPPDTMEHPSLERMIADGLKLAAQKSKQGDLH